MLNGNMALTKIDFNNASRSGGLPVTLRYTGMIGRFRDSYTPLDSCRLVAPESNAEQSHESHRRRLGD